ncbi:hypothetical protein SO694_0002537 [Aureococcus anophagefferens]|uniref:Uncharacterized protein n=1 Tax=Aureococcus anophagefferens TaxID=44056 RepID=A0ABR1FVI3_AURAN
MNGFRDCDARAMPTPIELKLSETCAITVFTESGAETGADDPTSREVWPAGYAAAMELLAIADERGGSLEGLAERSSDGLGAAGAARRGCVGDGGNATRWAAIVARAAANKRALARGARDVAPPAARGLRAFPQRLATHLDAAYGPGAVEVVVRAMSGTGSGRRRRPGRIIDAAATTDLLILDYAINDAVVATAKTYDVDDVAGLPEAKAVRQSTEVLLRVFTEAAARVAVLCTFYVPLSPASWTHWLKPDARGHAASDGSPTFTFVACATRTTGSGVPRTSKLSYAQFENDSAQAAPREPAPPRAYQDIVAPARARYARVVVSYRDAFWPDVAAPHVAYWYNTRAEHETCGRYGGPFRQDPHPTYEDHQLIADVLWYHWLQHAAAAHCARDDDGADGPGEPEPEPELSPEEAAPADPLVFRLPCGDGPIRLTILRSYASVGSAQVASRRARAPGAAPAVDVDDGAVTLVDAKWDRGESTYETIDVPRAGARCGAGARATSSSACCPATLIAQAQVQARRPRGAPGS